MYELLEQVHGDDALRGAPDWVTASLAGARKPGDAITSDQALALIIRDHVVLRLRELRMTQAQLAKRLGKSPAVISRILRSPIRSRLSTLKQIADALKLDLSDVLSA